MALHEVLWKPRRINDALLDVDRDTLPTERKLVDKHHDVKVGLSYTDEKEFLGEKTN